MMIIDVQLKCDICTAEMQIEFLDHRVFFMSFSFVKWFKATISQLLENDSRLSVFVFLEPSHTF